MHVLIGNSSIYTYIMHRMSKGYFTIDLFGKKATSGSSASSMSSQAQSHDPDVQRAIAVATKAVTKDEEGLIRQAFPLYQEAVGLFLAAVRKDSLGAAEKQQVKAAAANYLTRAEELKARIEREDREAEEQKKAKARTGSKGRGAEGGITRSTAASRAAAATTATEHRPGKPDDWDYTGGAARGAAGGFRSCAQRQHGAAPMSSLPSTSMHGPGHCLRPQHSPRIGTRA